ncbi:MAG: GcvT family protein [Thermomicrobiales bacterium]
MRHRANTVIVGAGIVGCSAAYFLAKGGLTDVVVIDRGPLFRTGGSTSHAPGLVFQNNASRTVSTLAQWTVKTYLDLSADGEPCYFPVASVEVATTEARWADLHRKVGFARSWGLDAVLLSPTETAQQVPLIDPNQILGAIRVHGDGIARSVTLAGRLAHRAGALGVEFVGENAVTGFDIRDGRVRGVTTSRGQIEAENVLVCGGIWGPLLGELAGVPIPLQPCAHPYVRTTPISTLHGLDGITLPIVRHQDASMYLWQEGERVGIGSYRHEPKLVSPAAIRDEPTAELPFDDEMMAFGRGEAARLMPALHGHGVTDRIYGMFSFTPDAQSLIGEVATVRGLWVAEAVWVTHGAGAGRSVADLMLTGACDLDLREVDPNRFAPHVAARGYVEIRGEQNYHEVYDIIHPRQQIERPRGLRRAPWFDRQRELGAHFFESNGWERAQWFESNGNLPRPSTGTSRSGWSAVEWSPLAAAEHHATREHSGLFDLSTFMKIEVSGPSALATLERLTCSDVDRPVGRVAYALLLNQSGGIESDLTVTRLETDHFLILAGSASGPRDLAWIRRQSRDLAGVEIRDVTSAWCGLGLWGPRAPEIMAPLVDADLSERAFAPYTARRLFVAGIPCLALRLSYVGEDGWELHVPTEYGGALWDALWETGCPYGLVAAGGTAMDSLRIERGFRALGTDLHAEYTPHAAGLSFAVTRRRDNFIGHAALATRRPDRCLSCLLLDDSNVVLSGNEPILAGDAVVGHVTSANFGYTVGQSIAYGYLPLEHAKPGATVELEYFGVRHAATVASEPLYDRRNRPDVNRAVYVAAAR